MNRIFGSALLITLVALTLAPELAAGESLSEGPVIWFDDDRHAIAEPVEREPNLLWTMLDDTIFLPLRRHTEPGEAFRRVGRVFGGDVAQPAANVNSLDEVPNSSWFTNRIGLFRMSAESASRGPGHGRGPDQSGPWTVISAKTEGVTPGFIIRDAAGEAYLIKFDPPGFLGMTTCAGVICNRIFHAAGYNVPDDAVVRFRRESLVLGEGVKIKLPDGSKRDMSVADLEAILDSVERLPDGSIHAISSKFVDGKPIGPFDYRGRRKDDPNDRIPHQNRRELRGLRIFAAWLNHFDTKQHNSLDAYHFDGEHGYVLHYLIDFASTLGSGATGPTPRYGWEYSFDLPIILGRGLALGLYEDPWRRIQRPDGLEEVGYFSSADFDPMGFDPLMPNSAFARCTDRDAYWAAKIISAFTDEHLAAICEEAGYRDPDAARFVARTLGERRDIVARMFFDRVAPLEYFRVVESMVTFRDLGVERGIYAREDTRYRARFANVDAERNIVDQGDWIELHEAAITLSFRPEFGDTASSTAAFFALECQVERGEGWGESVIAYFLYRDGRVVAVDH